MRPEVFKIRRKHRNTLDIGVIQGKYNKVLEHTRFINIGNPSESSAHLLYYYRQENELPVHLFINAHQIYKHTIEGEEIKTQLDISNIDTIIFIEDFCGSGTQATEYYNKFVKPIKDSSENIRIIFHSLFATQVGYDIVNGLGYDEVKTVFLLDHTLAYNANMGDVRVFLIYLCLNIALMSFGMFVVNLFPIATFDMSNFVFGRKKVQLFDLLKQDYLLKTVLLFILLFNLIAGVNTMFLQMMLR